MRIDFPKKEQVPALRQLWKEAFGDSDAFLDHFFATAFACRRCRVLADGDEAAAALYWFDCEAYGEKYAYLYAVATAEHRRGQGLCRALMEDTEKFLVARGYAGVILVPGDAGLSKMYGKMGYVHFGGRENVATEKTESLTKVDTACYAALRRNLLPPGGVIQEKENLAFLEGLADFFAGEDAVVTVSRETGEILERLEKGQSFSGKEPFAMCKLFKPGQMPEYFGFSFG